MKVRTNFLTKPARWCAVAMLSATLVACGGGSGDDPIDGDIGGDEVPDIGGEEVPVIGGEETPVTGGEEPGGPDTGSADGCEGLSGVDPNSSNEDWSDNCRIQVDGEHARSLYAQGIQRIVWCRGFTANQSIGVFADGIFGPNSRDQVTEFQRAQNIDDDGIVGPETWGALQDVLTVIDNQAAERNSHGVQGPNCQGVINFYQAKEPDGRRTGWTMAATPGNPEVVPFSIDPVPTGP